MADTIIIGGGAAGMMAAVTLLRAGKPVTIIEKNEKLGKKLYITGKGRCNVTNACATEDLFSNIVTNERFMYSSINGFTNYEVMGLFDELLVPLKIERGDRVFPESDKSSDIIKALSDEIHRLEGSIIFNRSVKDIVVKDNSVTAVILSDGKRLDCSDVIVATGGMSYPTTGSTGDGYTFAKKCGHKVTRLLPSLVPFNTKEDYIKDMMGLSLKNVTVSIYDSKKLLFEEFGEMLFTHFGVSGPIILSASAKLAGIVCDKELQGFIDLKPALDEEKLDERILRDFNSMLNKSFKNSLDSLLPKKLIPVVIMLSGIDGNKKINSISKTERAQLVNIIKHFPFTITGLRDFKEAIITKGGICVNEINPKTMESKKVNGLYFAGEVLDVDALTGGFNLQIAWSSAYAAANAVINK